MSEMDRPRQTMRTRQRSANENGTVRQKIVVESVVG